MKYYTIIAGVNGVGKSTMTGLLTTQLHNMGIILDADIISRNQRQGSIISSGKAVLKKIDECLEKRICFTQETTLAGHSILKTVQRASSLDYLIRLYYVGVGSVEESLKRIKNRVEKGGHNVPEMDVRRRYENRFTSLLNVLPYCNQAFFFDNENGFVQVAQYSNGNLICQGDYQPQWVKELKRLTEAYA